MGYASSSGLTSVTGSVTSAAAEYAVVCLDDTRNSAGTTVMGTVPANRKWYIIGAQASAFTTNAAGTAGSIQLNGVQVVSIAVFLNNSAASSLTWPMLQCPTLTAGQTVDLVAAGASLTIAGTVQYVEVVV